MPGHTHLDVEGSQWSHPPPQLVVNQAVPGTTPSRRRRHCGRITGIALVLCKRRRKNTRANSDKEGENAPTEKPKRTPKPTKNTRAPKRKTFSRVSGPKTHGKPQKKTSGADGLDRCQQPLRQKKFPAHLALQEFPFAQNLNKCHNRGMKKKIMPILLLSFVTSPVILSRCDDTPRGKRRKQEKEADIPTKRGQDLKGDNSSSLI